MNKLFSEENNIPEHCLRLKKVAGSATSEQNKTETLLSFKLSLFIRSWEQREFWLFSLFRQKKTT